MSSSRNLIRLAVGTLTIPGVARAPRAQVAEVARAPARARVAINQNVWFTYEGDHAVTPSLRLVFEAIVRRANGLEGWQQFKTSLGLAGTVRTGVDVAGGYAFVLTYPYGALPVPGERPEHRGWAQVQLSPTIGSLDASSRTRVERRWIGNPDTAAGAIPDDRWRASTRVRQQISLTIPLRSPSAGDRDASGGWDLLPSVEGFVRVAPEAGPLGFVEQIRTAASLRYHLARHTSVAAGYLYQFSRRDAGREQERNHTLTLTLASSAPLWTHR